MTKIVGARNRLYGIDGDGRLWFRGPFAWEEIPRPEGPDGPCRIVDVAFGMTGDGATNIEEYLHALTASGRLFLRDYTQWVELDVPA